MQQINMREAGDPSVLFIESAVIPEPKSDELLMKVAYAGVNRPDVMQRQGLYPMPKDVTPIMDLELSGEVVKVGSNVKNFNVGDLICALTDGRAYAEYCVVKVSQTLPISARLQLTRSRNVARNLFHCMGKSVYVTTDEKWRKLTGSRRYEWHWHHGIKHCEKPWHQNLRNGGQCGKMQRGGTAWCGSD
nr:alcohol dehydrogenase catalytic domain-containing protein [uncultured Haemophilus sp.]